MKDTEQAQEPKHKKTYGIALKYKNALDDNAKWANHCYTTTAFSLSEAQATMETPVLDYNSIDIRVIGCEEIA